MRKKSFYKNFRKRLSRTRSSLRRFFEWTASQLRLINQKITLVYAFQESKKSTVREWGISRIIFLSALFLITLFLSIHYLVTYQSREQILSQVQEENTKLDYQLDQLEDRVGKISGYQENYNQQMLKIYEHFGNIGEKSVWEKSARNKDIELIRNTWDLDSIDWLSSSTEREPLEKINQSRIQLLISIGQLKEIDKYMTLVEKISDHIPTGWPIKNKIGYKTSGFGTRFSPFSQKREFHTGIDIAAATGNSLIATANGVVIFSGNKRSFGNVIIIRHDFGYRTIYAHNDANLVKSGQQVKKNQIIAKVGNTGRSTGSHVHYEIRIGRQYVDPWPYIIAKF